MAQSLSGKKCCEVYDNVSCIYMFDNGVKMNFDLRYCRVNSTDLEEQIMCNTGTVELEKKILFLWKFSGACIFAISKRHEYAMFGSLPFAGTSGARNR